MESDGPVPDADVLTVRSACSGLFEIMPCMSGICGMPACQCGCRCIGRYAVLWETPCWL